MRLIQHNIGWGFASNIPASSCECERMFSELDDILEPRRRNITPQLLAAIQCVRRCRSAGFGDN
jgi:hypothetical protein